MNTIEISKEAEMQIKALKKISKWKIYSIGISMIGVAITYAGFAGTEKNIFMSILGIVIMIISTISAVIFNLGLKNGKRNVEKMLNVLHKGVIS